MAIVGKPKNTFSIDTSIERIPPHNIEAEQSLLGSMMISENAISVVAEMIKPEDFHRGAHAHIYQAILSLWSRGEPADPITISEELKSAGVLDDIGGKPYIHTLMSVVPTAANAKYYADIVERNAILRHLIQAATSIASMGYESPDDIERVIDQAESLIFGVSHKRISEKFTHIKDLLAESFEQIEKLYEKKAHVTGTPTGFTDLDNITSGLHPSDLIVVAGRPSMGKTSFALGMAQHVGLVERVPVALFSLEMSRQQLAQRLMCSEARVDAQSLRTGNLKEEDWPKLSNAVGRLAEAPIFIDDTPNITIMEVRAKARRLMTKHKLGLIVVDYLQLMQGGLRSESRQQEVSEISRSLKILGRELGVPVIAVSQLSRAVEQRTDKRPLLADLRESGCLSGGTQIMRADTGELVTMRELAELREPVPVFSLNDKLKLEVSLMTKVFPTGIKEIYDLSTRTGRIIRASANHPFLTLQGWVRLDELSPRDRIAVPRALSSPILATSLMEEDRIVLLAHLIGDGCYVKKQPLHYTNQDTDCLQAVSAAASRAFGIQPRMVQQEKWFHVYLPGRDAGKRRRNPILKWLDSMGIFNQRSKEKTIPKPIFEFPNEQIALFLRHLWATDGTISRQSSGNRGYVIYYASGSQVLAHQVQHLLLRLGIVSTIRVNRKRGYSSTYQLHIQGKENQIRFLGSVGIFGRKSELADEALTQLELIECNPNYDVLPRDIWSEVERARANSGLSMREFHRQLGWSHDGTSRRKRGVSRQRLQKILTVLPDEHLNNLSDSDIYWDEVISIEAKGSEEVFDATVPGNHNFVANDLIVHNSIEQDADLVIFIYRDEYYHSDTEEKGIAEILISKHRNGPTGMMKLAFLEHYTKFANLARGV